MTPTLLSSLMDLAATCAANIVRASLYGAAYIGLVWALLRLVPRVPASVRCALWWLAAIKLITALVWMGGLAVPVLPTGVASAPAAITDPAGSDLSPRRPSVSTARIGMESAGSDVASATRVAARVRPWLLVLAGLWAAGFAVVVRSMLAHIRRTARIARHGNAAPDAIRAQATWLAERLGCRRVPAVLMSNDIDTPLVTGLVRPVMMLPAGRFERLSEREQQMAICHEMLHLRRGDLWLGCVPALAECVFYFHPGARLAAREYALAREVACDAGVLRVLGAAPRDYGRLLLALGVADGVAGLATAGAARSLNDLKRRIVMLRDSSSLRGGRRAVAWAVALLAVCAIIPVTLVAKPTRTAAAATERLVSASNAGPVVAFGGTAGPVSHGPESSPRSTTVVEEPDSSQAPQRTLSYVLFISDNGTASSTMMSGSNHDRERAAQFRHGEETLLWVRLDGKEYVIRDADWLRRALETYRPVQEISKQQWMIGEQQGKIGAKQAEIGTAQGLVGTQQGAIGAQQAAVGSRQAELGAAQAELASKRAAGRATQEVERELETRHREIDEQMKALSAKMAELSKEMSALDGPMREQSAQMEALSGKMNDLSRQMQAAIAKAEADVRALIDQAIAAGVAQAVKAS